MKSIILICFLAVVAVALARPEEKQLYTDKYDNLDIDQLLGNRRLLVPYVDCTLDKGKCAPDAKELKEHIREALENNCAKCSEIHRKRVDQVIGHLINHEPEFWTELTAKYDPEHKYVQKYEKELKTIKA